MILPEQFIKTNSEDEHEFALTQWAAMNETRYPCLKWLHHIPNSGVYGDTKRGRQIRGSKMKALGVKSGVSDRCLPQPIGKYHGLYIEMKRPKTETQKSGVLSNSQKCFIDFVRNNNYYAAVCYSWEEARDCIIAYLEGKF